MTISEQISADMTAAMKARDEHRLSTLRMVKSALKNKEIDKRAALDDREAQKVLSTLINQRKDSIEQFTKGGRQELADKEAAEIKIIEHYLPQAVGEEGLERWSQCAHASSSKACSSRLLARARSSGAAVRYQYVEAGLT